MNASTLSIIDSALHITMVFVVAWVYIFAILRNKNNKEIIKNQYEKIAYLEEKCENLKRKLHE